jgi:hypothetical protein
MIDKFRSGKGICFRTNHDQVAPSIEWLVLHNRATHLFCLMFIGKVIRIGNKTTKVTGANRESFLYFMFQSLNIARRLSFYSILFPHLTQSTLDISKEKNVLKWTIIFHELKQ